MNGVRLNLPISAVTILCVVAHLLGTAADALFFAATPRSFLLKAQLSSSTPSSSTTLAPEFPNDQPLDSGNDTALADISARSVPPARSTFNPSHSPIVSAGALAGLGLFVRAP